MCPAGPGIIEDVSNEHHHQHYRQQQHQQSPVEDRNHGSKPTTQPQWNNLPLLSLYKIFKQLDNYDRLRASSTCRTWRSALFHRETWPAKKFEIYLCSYKLNVRNTIYTRCNQTSTEQLCTKDQISRSGFSTFKLLQRNPTNSPTTHDRTKNHNRHLKRFLKDCDKFITDLVVYFEPNCANNVIDFIHILRHLTQNEVSLIGNSSGLNSPNCKDLRSISIIPITPLTKTIDSERFVQLYHELTDLLRILLSKCKHFNRLSIGNLHELASSIEDLLKDLFRNETNFKTMKTLDICSIKSDPYNYIETTNRLQFFSQMKNLQCLSLDFNVMSNDLIEQLCELHQLHTLIVNVHPFKNHTGLRHDLTYKLQDCCPQLRLTLNLLHISTVHLITITESFFTSGLCLRVLRIYYLDMRNDESQLFLDMLDIISRQHSLTFETLILIDNVDRPKKFFQNSRYNSIVMLSWMCRGLQWLTIIGYELTSADAIAVARLRKDTLLNYYLPLCCIEFQIGEYDTMPNENYCGRKLEDKLCNYFLKSIQSALGDDWRPVDWNDLPDILEPDQNPMVLAAHRTMIEQTHMQYIDKPITY